MSLRRTAASGVRWIGAAVAVGTVLRLVVLAVLGRAMAPAEFGLVGMVLGVTAIMQAFTDLGLSGAIVHRRDLTTDQLSSLFWMAQAVGIALTVALTVATPVLVRLYDEPRLAPLIGWLALRFAIAPIGVPFQAVLQRDLAFRTLGLLQIAATVVGSAVAIVTVLGGAGVMALIWGELATVAVTTVLATMAGWRHWRPRMHLRWADLAGYLSFAARQIGERAFTLVAMNVDYILVGRALGPAALGVYAMAFEIASFPMRAFNPVLTRVAFPIFAKRQADDVALSRGYIELSRLLALVQFPVVVALAVLAPLLVPIFLGDGWASVVPLLRVLAALGALRVLANPAGSVFLAKGRADVGLYWACFVCGVNVVVFWFVAPLGVMPMAWSWVVLMALYQALLTMILAQLIGMRPLAYVRALARPVAIAALLGGVLVAGAAAVARAGLDPLPALAVLAVVAIAGGAGLAWAIERAFVRSMVRTFLGRG